MILQKRRYYIPDGTVFTLKIEGQPHAPIPEPSEITAKANGTYAFSSIGFTEPGKYTYKVKQIAPDDEKIIPDTNVFQIVVYVIRNDDGSLEGGYTISDQTGDGKPSIIAFSNDYKKETNVTDSSSSQQNDNPQDDDHSPTASDSREDASSETGSAAEDNGDDASSKNTGSPTTGEPLTPAFAFFFASGTVLLLLRRIKEGK